LNLTGFCRDFSFEAAPTMPRPAIARGMMTRAKIQEL